MHRDSAVAAALQQRAASLALKIEIVEKNACPRSPGMREKIETSKEAIRSTLHQRAGRTQEENDYYIRIAQVETHHQ